MSRWIRKDHRNPPHSTSCPYCGRWSASGPCKEANCLLCGATQCHGNGAGRGQCSICYYGLLAGWSHPKECGYKFCAGVPVAASVPRVGAACEGHLDRAKAGKNLHTGKTPTMNEHIQEVKENITKTWIYVD